MKIPEYIQHMINVIPEDIFIPMSFVRTGETEKTVYDTSGYVALSEAADMLTTFKVYDCIEKTVRALLTASEYMIGPEIIKISASNVYLKADYEGGNIKFYDEAKLLLEVDCNSLENGEIQAIDEIEKYEFSKIINSKVKKLINEIKEKTSNRNLECYLGNTLGFLNSNCSLCGLMGHIIKLKREARLCGME